jgi:Arc/MetJ-type ribon-helix-helix transcriptional regulator
MMDKYIAFSVTVPPVLDRELNALCRRESRSRSEVVREALRFYFGARRKLPAGAQFVVPGDSDHAKDAEFGAFTEWASELDRAYDVLGEK